MLTNGPAVNIYDAIGAALWVIAFTLVTIDVFQPDSWLGHLGLLVGLAAMTVSVGGIARRVKNEVLGHMDHVFTLGQESVRRLHH